MIDTGIVRPMDGLGRVVIPKEICKNKNYVKNSKFHIYLDNGNIILSPYNASDRKKEYTDLELRNLLKKGLALYDETLTAGVGNAATESISEGLIERIFDSLI